ncbi:flavoprotein [Kitasatospora sp. NPDC096147]|uniref:flavoprotein n=1 Tax=Kitasatospora sp. NPDC096147 TaxID=3364093 RepID=UPI0037F57DE5
MPPPPPAPRVLYLFGTAAFPVLGIRTVIEQAQAAGWDVCLGLTSTAADWLAPDIPALTELTGHLVKARYRRPGEPDLLPAPDAILFGPATFNSINSLAQGLTSSWVVGYTAEALGKGVPVAVLPCVNDALAAHPQYPRSLATLREAGARVLLPTPDLPWSQALVEVGGP